MKRSFPPPAREALRVLAGAAICCGVACTPNHDVKPGAPELVEFIIVQAGPSATMIKPDTPDCPAGIMNGAACLPMGVKADIADGGTIDADVPADGLCRDTDASNWCTCFPGADPKVGAWSCAPFSNVMAVIAVFDRLLNTDPLDPGDRAGLTDVVTASAGDLIADYSSTGSPDGLVFNLYGPFFGNFRGDGPSLFASPRPAFPSGAAVTVTLNPDKILAKDGHTAFTGAGPFENGTVTFTMAPFSAAVSAPPDLSDPTMSPAATVAFTNFVDPMVAEASISATANGAPIAVTVTSADGGASYSVLPMTGAWPAGAMIVVSVSATAKNVLDQAIDAAVIGEPFTAP